MNGVKELLLILLSVLIITGCEKEDTQSVEVKSRRVVADYYVGEILMVGAELVGADLTYKSSAWADKLEDVTDIGQSFEAIAGLNPDVIITINQDRVEKYESIAETILIPYGTYNPEELILHLGEILGQTDRAETWIKQFNKNIEELAGLIKDRNETYTIIDIWGGNAYLYGEHYGRGGYIIYNKLGLKGSETGEKDYIRKPDSYANVSIESLPAYVGDRALVMSTGDPKEEGTFFMDNVVWKGLEAVKSNKVTYLNSEDFWFIDPYSLDLQVELLKEVLSE